MSVIYGTPPVMNPSEGVIRQTNEFTERLLSSAAPGAFLVHHFTWMEHLPRWMAPWRRYAEFWFEHDSLMFGSLFASVEERLVGHYFLYESAIASCKTQTRGDDTPSIVSTLVRNEGNNSLVRSESSWLAATLL